MWSDRARITYSAALLCLLAALTVLAVPPERYGHASFVRWLAVAVAQRRLSPRPSGSPEALPTQNGWQGYYNRREMTPSMAPPATPDLELAAGS